MTVILRGTEGAVDVDVDESFWGCGRGRNPRKWVKTQNKRSPLVIAASEGKKNWKSKFKHKRIVSKNHNTTNTHGPRAHTRANAVTKKAQSLCPVRAAASGEPAR